MRPLTEKKGVRVEEEGHSLKNLVLVNPRWLVSSSVTNLSQIQESEGLRCQVF